jgi:hypothetical protein
MRLETLQCDGPGCAERVEASVDADTRLALPESWLMLSQDGKHDLLFHSMACVHAFSAPQSQVEPPSVPLRDPARSEAKSRKR